MGVEVWEGEQWGRGEGEGVEDREGEAFGWAGSGLRDSCECVRPPTKKTGHCLIEWGRAIQSVQPSSNHIGRQRRGNRV